jgi:Phosphotransferase enzyme family
MEQRQGSALDARVLEAATRFGIPIDELVELGGETHTVFATGDRVLRLGTIANIERELVAASAAAVVVPVPSILDRAALTSGGAVLATRISGEHPWAPYSYEPNVARRRGAACGEVQMLLGTVPAPDGLPDIGVPSTARPTSKRLLHLDLHPLNILMDEEDRVTAVLDWANAGAGDPSLDRARTATILYLEPQARAFASDPSWRAFVDGWVEAAQLDELPPESISWACNYMLEDLADRYSANELAHVAAAVDSGAFSM